VDKANKLRSLTLVNIIAIIAAKVKLAAKVAIVTAKAKAGHTLSKCQVETQEVEKEQPALEDKDKYKEVQTLRQMSTQLHKQVNKFFTAAEVIKGIVEVVEGVEQGVEEMEEDIEGSTIVEGDDSKPCFDTLDKEDAEFNNAINGDVNQDNKNI
jgi:hypothetical protein